MGEVICRSGIVLVLGLAVLLLSQGCYIEVDGKRYGKQDTALPGAKIEKGCVIEIERAGIAYPPEPSTVLFENLEGNERFSRYAAIHAKLEIGKCYEWKLGLGDILSGKLGAVAADTVREISRE